MSDSKLLKDAVDACAALAAAGIKGLHDGGSETADAAQKLEAAMRIGNATLEVRVDFEASTARLMVHHVELGEFELLALVPGPTDPAAGLLQ